MQKSNRNKKEESTEEEKEYKEVVFVFSQDSVSMVEVKTGIQDDEYIQILSGIDDNTEIVAEEVVEEEVLEEETFEL